MQVSWSKGSLLDRVALRWQRATERRGDPLDIFSELRSAKRVLIAPSDRVGGLFLGAPAYRLIRQAYPRAHIGLLVDETKAAIAEQIPFVDQVVTAALDKSLWTAAFKRTQIELQRQEFDLLFCLGSDCSFRLAQLCKASGARLRVGFGREGIDPFNFEVVGKTDGIYEVEQYLSLLKTIGLEGRAELHWSLAQDKAEQIRIRYLGDSEERSHIVAIDLARGEGKGLSKRHIDDIVGRVVERGARALLFFSLAEKKTVNYLKETYGNRVILFEQDDLITSAALIESSQILIACNTDLLHLAVSLQVPVVGIFAEKPERWIAADNHLAKVVQVQDLRAVNIAHIVQALDEAMRERRVRDGKGDG